jgi:outer membrane biosynthesis protein TonB
MSDPQAPETKTADPLQQWRELRDVYMGAWAKSMGETVNSEAYAQASGAMLESYLTTSAPFREAQKTIMMSALEQLHMPSQADFISLAERLSNLELLLDDMDAKLTQVLQFAASAASRPAPKVEATPAPKVETPAPKVQAAAPAAPKVETPAPKVEAAAPAPKAEPAPEAKAETAPKPSEIKSKTSAKTFKKGSR